MNKSRTKFKRIFGKKEQHVGATPKLLLFLLIFQSLITAAQQELKYNYFISGAFIKKDPTFTSDCNYTMNYIIYQSYPLPTQFISDSRYEGQSDTNLIKVHFRTAINVNSSNSFNDCNGTEVNIGLNYENLIYGKQYSFIVNENYSAAPPEITFNNPGDVSGRLEYGISPPRPDWISFSGKMDYVIEDLKDSLKTDKPDESLGQSYLSEFWYRFKETEPWILINSLFTIPKSNSEYIYFRSRIIGGGFMPNDDLLPSTVSKNNTFISIMESPYFVSKFKIIRLPNITFTPEPDTIICKGDSSVVTFNTGYFNNPKIAKVQIKNKNNDAIIGVFGEDVGGSIKLAEGNYTFVTTFLESDNSQYAYKEVKFTITTKGKEPPTIINHPLDSVVCDGSPVNFTFSANSFEPPTYSWTKAGVEVSKDSSFSISNAQISDSGFYKVEVTNQCGEAISNEAKLTVNTPSSVKVGDTLRTCESSAILLTGDTISGGATAAKWSIISGEGNLYADFTDKPDTVSFIPSAGFSGEVKLRLKSNAQQGCAADSADRIILVNPLPANQSLTPPGNHCYTESGVEIKLAGSQMGVSYQLKRDDKDVDSLEVGTGDSISFGNQTVPGVYTVFATDTLTGCLRNIDGTVTINLLPQPFSVGGGGSYCAGDEGVEITLNGSETGVKYQLVMDGHNVDSLLGTGDDITFGKQMVAGEYTVVATSNFGCKNIMSGSATVTINPLPQIFNVTGGGLYCAKGDGVEIALSKSQADVSYSLLDSSNTVKSIIIGTGSNISFGKIRDKGNYTVSAEDKNGCSSIMNNIASIDTIPTTNDSVALAADKIIICEGESVVFTATLNFTEGTPTYTWFVNGDTASMGSSTFVSTFTKNSIVNLKVVPVGVVCPSNSELNVSKDVTVNKLPIANAGVDTEICENSSVTLGQAAENEVIKYSWASNPVGFSSEDANPTVTPSTTTVYTLFAQDSITGCTNTDSVTVTVNPNPTFSILPVINNRCFSGKDGVIYINALGGTPDYSYSLDNGATYSGTSKFSGLIAKKYYARVKDSKGCTAGSTEVEITQPADPFVLSVLNHSNITCFGGSNGSAELKVAQGGISPFVYSINGNDWYDSNIFTGLSASTSKFYVKDAVACVVEVDNPITQPAQIVATVNTANIACKGGNSGKISLNVEGGTGSYTLALTANGQPVETKSNVAKTAEFTGLLAGTYTLTVTDASSCSVVVNEIQILEPENPLQISSITPNQPSCFGSSNGQITVAANGGWDDNYQFNLSGTDNSSGVFPGVASGNYTITVTDNLGCTVDSTFTLDQPKELVLSANVTNVGCFGESNGEIKLNASGGTLSHTFEIGGLPGNTKSNLLAGNYTVKVTDANGCVTSKTATVSQPELLKVNLSNWNNGDGDKVCTDTVRVTPTGGTAPYIIKFKDNSTYDCPDNGYLLHSLPNDTYKFIITDSHGCTVEDSATISNLPPPTLALVEAVPASCSYSVDGSITVLASSQTGSVSVVWKNGTTGNTLTDVAGGQYIAVATDQFGCTRTDTFSVSKPDSLIINEALPRNPTCYGGADGGVRVTVDGGTFPYSYLWSNGVQADSTGAVPSGEYTLTVNDNKGCVATKLFTVTDPPSMQPNLPDLITLCTNQTYMADAGVPGKYFVWLSNNGFSATTAKVELVLPGEYYLMVTDDNGCIGRDTLRIDSYAGVIDADFLMTDKAFVGDTIVLIEMSWPIPQSIEWIYPVASFSEIFRNEYSVLLIPQQEGTFNIGLVTFAGPCTQYLEKPIIIGPARPSNGTSEDNLPLFREVVAYPNPNNGNFELFIDMNRESNIMVEVFTMYGKRVMLKEYRGLSTYRVPTTINQISGMYLVRVTSGSETRSLRVVIQ